MDSWAGAHGWAGWQWMFLIEAIPAILMGVATLLYLDNGIRSAKWLNEREKQVLEAAVAHDSAGKVEHPSLRALFSDYRIWWMSLIYFTAVMGQYGLTFWMPTLVKAAGVKGVLQIGLLTAIPYGAAVAAMLFCGHSADKHRERRWHLAIPMLVGAVGLIGSVLAAQNTAVAIGFLSLAAAGIITSAPLFWSLPTAFLTGASAAAGIAAVNSVGNLAGFASPYLIGWLKDLTASTNAGMYVLSGILIIGAAITLAVPAKLVNR
jgi:nitrate/nitrite transporter NarK